MTPDVRLFAVWLVGRSGYVSLYLPGKSCSYLFLGMNGTSNIPQLNYKVSNDKNIADFHELAVLHTIMYSPSVWLDNG